MDFFKAIFPLPVCAPPLDQLLPSKHVQLKEGTRGWNGTSMSTAQSFSPLHQNVTASVNSEAAFLKVKKSLTWKGTFSFFQATFESSSLKVYEATFFPGTPRNERLCLLRPTASVQAACAQGLTRGNLHQRKSVGKETVPQLRHACVGESRHSTLTASWAWWIEGRVRTWSSEMCWHNT